MKKHILSDRNGWIVKNGHSHKPYVYKYNPEGFSKHFDVSENCFCGYLDAVLLLQFQYWYRNLPDVIRVKEKVFNEETGKYENKIRFVRYIYKSVEALSSVIPGSNKIVVELYSNEKKRSGSPFRPNFLQVVTLFLKGD